MEKNISEIRDEINKVDAELLKAFEKRMSLANEVAEYKIKNNMPVYDRKREREILNRVEREAGDELGSYAKVLYSTLFQISRSYQLKKIENKSDLSGRIRNAVETTPRLFPKTAKVACQGVEGAYSQHACDRLFGNAQIAYYKTWEDAFKAVESGECKYGVLPLENSTAGTVNKVYDLLGKYKYYIVKSVRLKIYHSLLVKKGTKPEDIKEIVSHEQALSQCSKF